jgi:hypothetical protein
MKKESVQFSDKKWEKIIDDAFSPYAENHNFSKEYNNRKNQIIKDFSEEIKMKNTKNIKKPIIVLISAAAIIAAIPTTAFAASHIGAYFEKNGRYQQKVIIENNEESDASENIKALDIKWLPDGMKYDKNNGKYSDNNNRGLTFLFWKTDKISDTINHDISYTISQQTYTYDDKTVLYALKDSQGYNTDSIIFNQEIWVSFDNSHYAVQIYATSDITEDEIKKIAENLSLKSANTETASLWNDNFENDSDEDSDEIEKEYANLCNTGDEIISQTDNNDPSSFVSVKVNSINIQNTFDNISTDGVGNYYDYSSYMNNDKTVKDSIMTFYKSGDGVNSLDEKISEENVKQSIVLVNLTYTNTGNQTAEKCVCPELVTLNNDNSITYPYLKYDTDDIFHTDSNSLLKEDSMAFSFYTNHESSKNNITDLKSGQSADVTLAFLVDENSLDDLYLKVLYNGNEISEESKTGSPVVKVIE